MKITIRQLEVFDTVATLGSVTDAAERLGMSQSAVSSALTDLQFIMKRPLFARARGRKLQITDEGKRLRPHIRSFLSDAQDIEAGVEAPLQGTLVIGASATIAETVLPEICVRFMNCHPGVQIQIQSATSGELFLSVARFELETALIEYFPSIEGLELVKWRTDELWLVVAPNHPLAEKKKLKIKQLIGMNWCSREAHASVTSRLRVLLHEELGQMNTTLVATSNWAVRLAAIAGGGIACLSRSMVEDDIVSGKLVRLNVVDFHFTRTLSLARPKAMRRSRLAVAFDRFLLENGHFDSPAPLTADSSV
jgi:DNA-binding transcriptional LysR family regulator